MRCGVLALLALAAVPAAQTSAALAAHAAELRDVEAGSLDVLNNTAHALIDLFRTAPDEALSIDWDECAFDLVAAYEARGEGLFFRTYVPWRIAVELRTTGAVAWARDIAQAALAHLPEGAGDSPHTAFLHLELADFARHFGDWPRARLALGRARALLVPSDVDPFEYTLPTEDLTRSVALGTWFDIMGQLYFDLGRGELAAQYFDEHLARALRLRDSALFWGALDNLARLALAMERFDEVDAVWGRAQEAPAWVDVLPADRPRIALSAASAALTRAHRRGGEVDATLEALVAIREDPGTAEHDALFADLLMAVAALDADYPGEVKAALAEARRRRAAWASDAPASTQAAFALVALQGRAARATQDSVRIASAAAEARAAIEPFLASWSRTPVWPGGVGFLLADWRQAFAFEALALMLEERGPVDGAVEALELLLRTQARGTLTRAMGAGEVGLAEVRAQLLGEGRGALIYVPGRERSLVFAVDATSVRAFELAPDFRLRAARRAFEEAALAAIVDARDTRFDGAVARASALYLPPEVWKRIRRWSEILVVGADDAGVFGFEALEPIEGQPVGWLRAVSHVPSLAIGVQLAQAAERARASGRAGCLVVAPASTDAAPAFLGSLARIPFDEDHAQALGEIHGNAQLLRAADAVSARVGAGAFDGVRAVTFVAHGIYDPQRERPGGLLLEDGVLWCADVAQLSVPPLVSLVACGGGRGPRRRGDDGSTHLGAAFLQAGARVVMLGQTELEYRASLGLDRAFQQQVALGASPAEALRSARVAMRTTAAGRRLHRAHDLLVRVYGLGATPLVAERTPPRKPVQAILVAALAALLVGLGWLVARRRTQRRQVGQKGPLPERR